MKKKLRLKTLCKCTFKVAEFQLGSNSVKLCSTKMRFLPANLFIDVSSREELLKEVNCKTFLLLLEELLGGCALYCTILS
jgi:hypothetical protein